LIPILFVAGVTYFLLDLTFQNALKGAGAEFHYEFDELNAFAVTLPTAALDGISRNPNVVLIEEDAPRFPISIMQSNVVAAAGQTVPYGVDMVQARDVWDANRDGAVDSGAVTASNRKICIIDSGYYTGHEDLPSSASQVAGYNGNLPWNQDGSGHGTHVAGTIAAMNNALGVVGVTPGTVNIYVVRVFGNDGAWVYSSTLIDAAYKCRDNGANIISMSLGGSLSNNTEKNGFASLYANNNILSIAAAGNDGNNRVSYPAGYDSVVSIAAVDSAKTVATFSQYNSDVELAAPGVGVLSTVPYLNASTITVNGVTYSAGHIEFSGRGSASGSLVNGLLCDATNAAWAGKLVLCERGTVTFYDKVHNVELSGGAAAVIYNNVPGSFSGTLSTGNSSTIIGISLSQEDGQYLVANQLGQSASISSAYTAPASGYEYYDGTSMATPHASAVAALVWSSKPTATNAQVRAALQSTAIDLGAAGRDNYYGYGLVQAKAAITALAGSGGGSTAVDVFGLTSSATAGKASWKANVTITVGSAGGTPVTGVTVTGTFNSTAVSCKTDATGKYTVSASVKNSISSVVYTVTSLSGTGFTYDTTLSNAPTSVTISKP
jgi:subtilisin family serine protease